jgi:hypothetical protein
MAESGSWNPWKLTAIGLVLVMVIALVTGLVVANWSGAEAERKAESATPPTATVTTPTATARPAISRAGIPGSRAGSRPGRTEER